MRSLDDCPPSMLEAALTLARHGCYVLPLHTTLRGPCSCDGKVDDCKPGKHPMGLLVSNGAKNASIDPRIITDWWRKEPDANIGIACGPSKLITVDEDPRNGGDETLAALKVDGFRLPDTAMSKTGGGGHHYLYRRPEGVPIKDSSLGPGVELKINGYIVAPPSIHLSGARYEWLYGSSPLDGVRIVDAPGWLIERLSTQSKRDRRSSNPLIDWSTECPPEVLRAIQRHTQLGQLWDATEPLDGQEDVSPSNFRFLLQGQLAAYGFTRQQVADTSIAFTNLRSEHGVSDEALLNEIDDAFSRASELKPITPVALRVNSDPSERAVMNAVNHSILEMKDSSEGAKRLLVAMSRYSPDGLTAWAPDVRLAEDLGWPAEDRPKGSRRVRRYKQKLLECGCLKQLSRPSPGNPVRYQLNTVERHPHRRTDMSYE